MCSLTFFLETSLKEKCLGKKSYPFIGWNCSWHHYCVGNSDIRLDANTFQSTPPRTIHVNHNSERHPNEVTTRTFNRNRTCASPTGFGAFFVKNYLAKWAKALLASAILWVSAFFLMAFPWLFTQSINSCANFSAIGFPFLLRAPSKIHFVAKASFLSPLTSIGT